MILKTVSVVIPAYNCENTLPIALQSLLTLKNLNPVEIIVVDDGSTDNTSKIVKTFPMVKYVYQKNSGPAATRNRGFKESTGEIVFFTDSDCIPQEDWIVRCVGHFDKPEIGVVAGTYGIANPENILARSIHSEIMFRHNRRMPDFPKSFGSYNFCVRRNIFDLVGGFDESYPFASGEDNDLSYKILEKGYKIYFERSAIVKHFHQINLLKYLREQWRHGFWRVKMYRDHPKMSLGDDYTFWKDIAEPALILSITACALLSLLWAEFFLLLAFFLVSCLIFIEIFYGWVITKRISATLFFAPVMFVRALARTAGFCTGSLHFSAKKSVKNIK